MPPKQTLTRPDGPDYEEKIDRGLSLSNCFFFDFALYSTAPEVLKLTDALLEIIKGELGKGIHDGDVGFS